MVREAEEVKADGDQQVLSVELAAPEGWKKFIPKKVGFPKRNEMFFISPSGEEIRSKKQLDHYLRSHPGGPSSSEFYWGFGDTPRRSARLRERTKETDASNEEPPKEELSKKRVRHSVSKKATIKKMEGVDSEVEDDAPEEEEPPKKREGHSTLEKGAKPRSSSEDAGIEDEAPENDKLVTQELEGAEDVEMKDAEDGSDIETNQKKDAVDAEVEEVTESEKIATQVVHNIEVPDRKDAGVDSKDESEHQKDYVVAEVDSDLKDLEVGSVNDMEKAAAKAISEEGTEQKTDDLDAEVVDGQAPEREEIVPQEQNNSIEISDMKYLDGSVKGEGDNSAQSDSVDEAGTVKEDEGAAEGVLEISSAEVDSDVKPVEKDVGRDSSVRTVEKETLLNHNLKAEQVSPSKALPAAACIDLKSREKASALV